MGARKTHAEALAQDPYDSAMVEAALNDMRPAPTSSKRLEGIMLEITAALTAEERTNLSEVMKKGRRFRRQDKERNRN